MVLVDDDAARAVVEQTGQSSRRNLSVVLLDDHEVVLDGLRRVLERDGMEVVGAFLDAPAAFEFLAAHAVDLLVVDLRLKSGTAVEVVQRAHTTWPEMAIAVLTSFEDRPAAAATVRSGATGFLLKDALSEELSQRLRSVAEGNLVVDQRLAGAVLQPAPAALSEHERTILNLVAEGQTNRDIGVTMHLSPYTIKDYLARTMRTLGTTTRAETVARALQQGLLSNGAGNS